MKIASAETMRKIDNYCISKLNIPGIILMENAALKVIKNINLTKFNSFTIVCGKGNNGGDGFVVGRHLLAEKKNVEFFLIGSDEGISNDAKINLNILKNMGIKINRISNMEDLDGVRESIQNSDMTIDAIFGTGLSKKVEGIYNSVISIINENSSFILSVDVPSGFQSNTGKILGNCVRANVTVSFQLYKKGFVNYGTDKFTGTIIIENISIPEFVVDKFHDNEFIMDKSMIQRVLKRRDKYSHKGDYGRVLVISGSRGFTGAAYISTEGAVRSGAGLVTLCCEREILNVMSSKLVEAMTVSFDEKEKLENIIRKCDAIAIGPGMGTNQNTLAMLCGLVENAEAPMVIDADGINVLKDNLHILKNKKSQIIITPHLGEMSKITGLSIDYIKENRMEVSKKFAEENDVIVLLKGYNTIITDGKTLIVNPTGNSSMASGGMGDCLTGMITSFIAQGYNIMSAACIAAFVHGYCGEKLSKDMFNVNASDVLNYIPFAIKELQS